VLLQAAADTLQAESSPDSA